MSAFAYRDCPYPLRPGIVDAHRLAWDAIAAPGNWWSGAERVAIAAEVRRSYECELCARRKAALSPHTVTGEHDHGDALPPPTVEVIHQIASDPGRLTRSWYERLLTDEFTDAHYVEIIGVVVTVICIDAIHRARGLPLEPLPEPESGEPSRYRPAAATLSDEAWVPMITGPASRGTPEEDLYPGGRTGNVISAMSLVPDAVRLLNATQKVHYIDFADSGMVTAANRKLTRPQIELIAARVSAINDCFY